MRNRILSPTGDYTFGQGASEFLINTPAAVAQAVQTRLQLAQGEWYLDRDEGTPYSTEILGENTQDLYDQAIRERILGTPGVMAIVNYASYLDSERQLTVSCTINTIYGTTTVQQTL